MKGKDNAALLLSTVAFLVFSLTVGVGVFRPVDTRLLGLAQKNTSGVLDAVGIFTSVAGGVEFVGVAAVALAAVLYAGGRRLVAGRLLIALLVTGLVEVAAKMSLPQPAVPDDAARTADPSLFDLSTSYPYPSGHILRMVLLLGTIYRLWPNRLGRALILTFLVVSAASRVYLGTHWPSDVIGGALLGVAGLTWVFAKERSSGWRSRS